MTSCLASWLVRVGVQAAVSFSEQLAARNVAARPRYASARAQALSSLPTYGVQYSVHCGTAKRSAENAGLASVSAHASELAPLKVSSACARKDPYDARIEIHKTRIQSLVRFRPGHGLSASAWNDGVRCSTEDAIRSQRWLRHQLRGRTT